MADETTVAEAPKKSNKMLMIIIALALVVVGGGGAGAFFMLKGNSADAAEEKPVKGIVTAAENTITVNLAEGHYLKLGFAIQQTEESGDHAIDLNEAYQMVIDQYTGRTVAELSTAEGRAKIKEDLVAKLVETYTHDDVKQVMDIYYTSFVTQ